MFVAIQPGVVNPINWHWLSVWRSEGGLGEDEGKGAMRSCVLLLLMGDAISFSLLPQRERDRRRENDIRLYKRLMSY